MAAGTVTPRGGRSLCLVRPLRRPRRRHPRGRRRLPRRTVGGVGAVPGRLATTPARGTAPLRERTLRQQGTTHPFGCGDAGPDRAGSVLVVRLAVRLDAVVDAQPGRG